MPSCTEPDDQKVDRKKYAMTCYARAIFYLKKYVEPARYHFVLRDRSGAHQDLRRRREQHGLERLVGSAGMLRDAAGCCGMLRGRRGCGIRTPGLRSAP